MSTQVPIGIIALRTNREQCITLNQTYINLNPFFQRTYEAWPEQMKTRFIESILLQRAMNPIWTVENSEDGSEEVLDGMHRLTTALNFFNNKFTLGTSLCTLKEEEYKNKSFDSLSSEDKNKIRNYNFTFNRLDSSYRNDANKLQEMYEILNASSKQLNKHEFRKPIYKPYYDIINQNSARWYKTPLFKKDKSLRGDLETELTKILALSEERLPEKFSSINDIATQWEDDNLGDCVETVRQCLEKNGLVYIERLNKTKKYMNKYIEVELFPEDSADDSIVALIIITRTVALIKKEALFSRHLENLITIFKTEIMEGNIQNKLDCTARNAIFQQKLICKIDELIRTELGEKEEPRLFTKEIINAKLQEQNRVCPLCNKQISLVQPYEGDHIIPWVKMGRTIPENCQVVHKRCHKRK